MKTFAKVAGGLLVLAALAWTGMFLYWHVTILGALRTLEAQPGLVEEMRAFKTLQNGAGCRALPYLVAALQPAKSQYFLERASLLMLMGFTPVVGKSGGGISRVILRSGSSLRQIPRRSGSARSG